MAGRSYKRSVEKDNISILAADAARRGCKSLQKM